VRRTPATRSTAQPKSRTALGSLSDASSCSFSIALLRFDSSNQRRGLCRARRLRPLTGEIGDNVDDAAKFLFRKSEAAGSTA
jgi:hypothetical protein